MRFSFGCSFFFDPWHSLRQIFQHLVAKLFALSRLLLLLFKLLLELDQIVCSSLVQLQYIHFTLYIGVVVHSSELEYSAPMACTGEIVARTRV